MITHNDCDVVFVLFIYFYSLIATSVLSQLRMSCKLLLGLRGGGPAVDGELLSRNVGFTWSGHAFAMLIFESLVYKIKYKS